MAGFSVELQHQASRSCSISTAANAHSEKLALLVWAQSEHSPREA